MRKTIESMEFVSNIHLISGLVGTRPLQLYFLNGTEGRILLDTGYAPDPARLIFSYLREIGLAASDIDIVINTHCDQDHCGGNHAVKAANPQAQITCGEADRPLLSFTDACPGLGRGGNAPAFTLGTKNKATRPKVEGDRLGDAAHQL